MRQVHRLLVAIVGLCLCWLTLSGCTASANNAQLEAQVLQIIRDHPEVLIESVQSYRENQQKKLQQTRQEFLQKMTTDPALVIADSPSKGSLAKKVILLEFLDFQCPFCAQSHAIVQQFLDQHQDEVLLVYKHLPLTSIHPEALPAAKASWAALQQQKFWEFESVLFERQKDLGEELYVETAQELNLDLEQFNRDRKSPEAAAAIQADVELAGTLGINSTPFFFMNEKVLAPPISVSSMTATLAELLARRS